MSPAREQDGCCTHILRQVQQQLARSGGGCVESCTQANSIYTAPESGGHDNAVAGQNLQARCAGAVYVVTAATATGPASRVASTIIIRTCMISARKCWCYHHDGDRTCMLHLASCIMHLTGPKLESVDPCPSRFSRSAPLHAPTTLE